MVSYSTPLRRRASVATPRAPARRRVNRMQDMDIATALRILRSLTPRTPALRPKPVRKTRRSPASSTTRSTAGSRPAARRVNNVRRRLF